MSYNRASYQHHNPNMSLKPDSKGKSPILVFTSRGLNLKVGETPSVLIKPCDVSTLRTIATNQKTPMKIYDVLLSLINGKTIQVNSFNVTLSYR